MPVGLAAAILTTLNSVKEFGCLYLHRYTRHGLLPAPAFTAFKNPLHPPQEQSMTRFLKMRQRVEALNSESQSRLNSRHFAAFDSELRICKLLIYRS